MVSIERRVSQFSTICAKIGALNLVVDKVTVLLGTRADPKYFTPFSDFEIDGPGLFSPQRLSNANRHVPTDICALMRVHTDSRSISGGAVARPVVPDDS